MEKVLKNAFYTTSHAKTILFILLVMLFNEGCNNELAAANITYFQEDNIELTAYFCPHENCSSAMINEISDAKNSVHCAFYDLDLMDLIATIAKKSHEADVKIIIDKNNYAGQIKGDGVKIADSKQYMHNKFCIIDGNKVFTGSLNPTANGVNFNNNNLIVISSEYIGKNYEDEFNELWNGVYSSGEDVKYETITGNSMAIENYFCPEDNCKERLIKNLKGAEKSIYFMTYSFTDEDIADEILYKNIETKGIFDSLQAGSQYSQYKRLKDFGLDVKKDKNKKIMHHKVFIIDYETVVTGSFNPTESGNLRNDENLLIIRNKEIADKFLKEFELLWN